MRVLVTGATGFLGTRLVRHLESGGHRVLALSRDGRRAAERLGPNVPVCEHPDTIGDGAVDAVVNLAGLNLASGRWNDRLKRAFIDSRVEVTNRVVRWMATLERPPDILVSQSAVGYYGARGDTPVDETAAPGNEYQSRLCLCWERAARSAEKIGVRVCLTRTGAVLDPGGGPLSGLLPPFRRGFGGWLGDGRQWLSWIHVQDWLRAVEFLLASETASGVWNLTAPEPATNREFARTLGRVLGRPAWLRVPGWAVRVQAGGMARLFLTGQRVIPERLVENGFRFHHAELREALASLLNDDNREPAG